MDEALALLCRISLLADPVPDNEDPGEPVFGATPPRPAAQHRAAVRGDRLRRPRRHHHQTRRTADAVYSGPADRDRVEPDLAVAALVRSIAGPPEQTDADVNRMFTRAMAWQECPISRDRMIEINQLAL